MKKNKKTNKQQGYRPKKSVNDQNIKNKVAPVHSNNRTKLIIAGIAVVSVTIIIVLIINLMPSGSSKRTRSGNTPSVENASATPSDQNQSAGISDITAENAQNNAVVNPAPNSNNSSSNPALNPPHGQPGHRCDIAVGAPLNSAPVKNNTTPMNNPPANNNPNPVIDQQTMPDDTPKTEQINPNATEITFAKTEHDYGAIAKGSDGGCKFSFENTGKEPLILKDAKASCGCTVPSWPKEPILPGKTGVIDVMYDTKKAGPFNKTVTVTSNAKNSTVVLTIKGEVTE